MDKYEILEKQIDWKNLLLANYRSLGLSEDEVMVILMSQYCIEQNEKTITPELLSLKMSYSQKQISNILTSLSNKSLLFFEEDEDGKFMTTLKGIKKILIDDFIDNQEDNSSDSLLYKEFEQNFGRPLTFAEVETLKSWINSGESEEKIRLALKEAINNKAKNMRYIDKILLNWKQQDERKQEGYTTVSEEWRKDMKETIEIANIKWVNKK